MKKARLRDDSRIVELAKAEYGEKFQENFSYRVAGTPGYRVMVRPDAIARRYRSINRYIPAPIEEGR